MASKGKGDNPFSFKAFINKRESGSDVTISNKQFEEKERKKKMKKEDKLPEKQQEGNPFSFKNFIKKSETDKPHPRAPLTTNDDDSPFSTDEEDSPPLPPPPPILPDPSLPPPILPDPLSQKILPIDKDIFASSSDSEDETPHHTKLHEIPLSDPVLRVPDPLAGGSEEEEEEEEEGDVPLNINPFPEVAMIVPDESKHDLVLEINEVKTENDSLKKQVANLEKLLKKEKTKSQSLKDEIKRLQEKEKRDTQALEEMIQKVEDNLKTATQRSVNAETVIVKLKSQIQSLQTQLAQANPQAIHKSYEDLVTGVRDKSNYASQQLRAAALKADLQLKELCQGIETLKRVSDILENIDSIYEVKH